MKKILVFLAFMAVSLFGSATLIDGSQQNINFNSEPSGATVKKNGMIICTSTPCSASIDRSERPTITFSKEGYLDFSTVLGRTINIKTLFNGIFTTSYGIGASSVLTDLVNGSFFEYTPNNIFVTLGKKD